LLDVTRAELRDFALKNKIRFREDATNAGLDLPRNRVRNELLPLLRRHYQPALTKTVLRLMDIVGAEANVVGEMARRWMKTGRADLLVSRDARQHVPTDPNFRELPAAVQRRVLQLQLAEFGVAADFGLVERLRRSPAVFVNVSPNFSVARDAAGKVSLRKSPTAEFKVSELTVNLADKAGEVNFAGVQLRWDFEGAKKTVRLARRPGLEFFDADRVGGQIILRHWRAGDRFQPIGLQSAVKLQDLFTNQKIPRARRRDLVVAEAANGGIFWVQDLRMSEPFKLTPATRRRLVWRWRCGSR